METVVFNSSLNEQGQDKKLHVNQHIDLSKDKPGNVWRRVRRMSKSMN